MSLAEVQDRAGGHWYLLTFGAGSFPLRRAAARLRREAIAAGVFEDVFAYTERRLKFEYPAFWTAHSEFLDKNSRGFGYWLWKPFLILQMLESLPEGDGLAYLDAGCHLNFETEASRARFSEYLLAARRFGVVATQLKDGDYGLGDLSERAWNRKIVTDYFRLGHEALDSGQFQSGIIFIENSLQSRNLISEWFEACVVDNYALLVDAPANEINDPNFVEHRHDQAVFSALAKIRGVKGIPDETYWRPDWHARGIDYPIWAMRNKTGVDPNGPSMYDLIDRVYSTAKNFVVRVGLGRLIKNFCLSKSRVRKNLVTNRE